MDPTRTTRRDALRAAASLGATVLAAAALAEETAPAAPAPLAHFSFTKLQVADLEKCAAFYTSVAGLTEQSRVDTDSGGRKLSEIIFNATMPGGASFVLIHYYDSPKPVVGELILGFYTSDIDGFAARAVAAGGSIVREPWEITEMKLRVAFVADPEGHVIEIVEEQA
ncbi:MAG: VOC family protein [Deltaproteobacteria bacterium]|nr:VOC family protein [Deltaproteobacteria bacterium]